jgi:phage terminase Nu1 subunit (DNA packaging protein)
MQQLELSASAAPMIATPVVVSKSAYARYRRVSPAYISKLISKGKITHPALRVDGKINRLEADRQIEAQSDPVRSIEPEYEQESSEEDFQNASLPTYAAERAAHENLKRQRLEIELSKTKGELVEKTEVEYAAEQASRELRSRLMELPEDVAALCAEETNEQKIRMILREAIIKCLTKASEDFESGNIAQQTETIGASQCSDEAEC